MTEGTDEGRDWRNFYGRTKGKTLRPLQKARLAGLDRWRLAGVTRDENPGRVPLDGLPAPLWLEIGFGSGEHLAHQARANPGVTILGAEPFVNGVATLLMHLEGGPSNVLIHDGDARDLLDVLPEGSVAKAFLLYPDPWPKARHHKRRFVMPGPLGQLHRALAPGAEWRVASDIGSYVEQAREQGAAAGFTLVGDSGEPWADWTRTRYEAKALREGRVPRYLTFRRP